MLQLYPAISLDATRQVLRNVTHLLMVDPRLLDDRHQSLRAQLLALSHVYGRQHPPWSESVQQLTKQVWG